MGALQPVRTIISTGVPIWQDLDDTAQGGFILDTTGLIIGSVLKGGQLMTFDELTRLAKPMKNAELYANAANNATVYQVKKGHAFSVGDIFGFVVGGAAHTITAIDTSNAAYDSITVDVTLGTAQVAGDVLFSSAAAGANAAALNGTPKGLLYQDTDVIVGNACAVVLDGIVYERRVPKASAAAKALIPNIIYSQSY